MFLHQLIIVVVPTVVLGLAIRNKPKNPPNLAAVDISIRKPDLICFFSFTSSLKPRLLKSRCGMFWRCFSVINATFITCCASDLVQFHENFREKIYLFSAIGTGSALTNVMSFILEKINYTNVSFFFITRILIMTFSIAPIKLHRNSLFGHWNVWSARRNFVPGDKEIYQLWRRFEIHIRHWIFSSCI